MLLDEHAPVMRRKDLGVTEPVTIESNLARRDSRRHIQILLGGFLGACGLEGLVVGLIVRHPFLATIAGLIAGVVYFVLARELGDTWIARSLKTKPATGPRVVRLATAEAREAGIPAPRVLVAPGDLPNAASFALRRRWLVTTEAAEQLDELALEGLVAHEIIHLRDGDSAVAALYLVLAGSPSLVLRGAGPLALLSIPLWPAAFVLRLFRRAALPAAREMRADVAAAMLTRYPPGIVEALRAAGAPTDSLRAFDAFWFVNTEQDAERRAALIAEM
jgi:heat shock protein HtpX